VAVAATLLVLPVLAATQDDTADRAVQLLATNGALPVVAAGPYVELGSFRIQVSTKLGQPGARLPDGTWLYPNFNVNDSEATGTLVVRFTNHRVSGLSLVAPSVATAMTAPKPASAKRLVAVSP
jgi:hypothetical protein